MAYAVQYHRSEFFKGLEARTPVVTFGLLASIGLMFLLQSLWAPPAGDTTQENLFTIAMGALYAPLVEQGQWWRMISAGFLHGGLMHVGMNGFVLYLLGGQVERVLGGPRFLVLYTVSLLGGSLASTLFGAGFSVGASGAIWGLLGAQVSLAYGRPPVLPQSIAAGVKQMAKRNVILNLGISLLPGIDAAAHVGGGIAGALLLASGLLYPSVKGPASEQSSSVPKDPEWLRLLAGGCVLLLAYGIFAALVAGQPWRGADALMELRTLLSA